MMRIEIRDEDYCNDAPFFNGLDPYYRALIFRMKRNRLLMESGAVNVASAVLRWWRDEVLFCDVLQVSFDSRAWTGLS